MQEMELTLIFLSTCIVCMTCYHYQLPVEPPWNRPIFQQDMMMYNYPYLNYPEVARQNEMYNKMMKSQSIPRVKAFYLPASDVEGRVKKLGFKKGNAKSPEKRPVTKPPVKKPPVTIKPSNKKAQDTKPKTPQPTMKPNEIQKSPEDEQNKRFLYELGYSLLFNPAAKASALIKTVTFTLTSTCTALTFTTCIPSSGLVSPIVICNAGRRRRGAPMIEAVSPTTTLPVAPTSQPKLSLSGLQNSVVAKSSVITSSKQDISIHGLNELKETEHELEKQERFVGALGYSLWQAFATGTTVTSWSVTSTTITQTINPPAGTPFPCLPSGITTCAAAVTIG